MNCRTLASTTTTTLSDASRSPDAEDLRTSVIEGNLRVVDAEGGRSEIRVRLDLSGPTSAADVVGRAIVGPHRQPMRVGVFMRRDDRVEVVGDAVPLRPEVRIADRARAGVNRLGMGRCPAQQGPRGHDAPHLTEPFLFGATPEQTVDAGSQAKTLQGNKGNGREQQM